MTKKKRSKYKLEELPIIPNIERDMKAFEGENPFFIIAVSALGYIQIVDTLNYEKASQILVDDALEYIEYDFPEGPGIYFVEFTIEGSRDYWGGYDSWSDYRQLLKYKVEIQNKTEIVTKNKYDDQFPYKKYEGNGEECPHCLFTVDQAGDTVILDIFNEEKANPLIMNEIPYDIDNLKYNGVILDIGIYKGKIKSVGDMEHIFDDDVQIVNLFEVEKIKLVLEKSN